MKFTTINCSTVVNISLPKTPTKHAIVQFQINWMVGKKKLERTWASSLTASIVSFISDSISSELLIFKSSSNSSKLLFHCCLCLSFWTSLSNHPSLLQKASLLWPKTHYEKQNASIHLRSALQHINLATDIDTPTCVSKLVHVHLYSISMNSLIYIKINKDNWVIKQMKN